MIYKERRFFLMKKYMIYIYVYIYATNFLGECRGTFAAAEKL